MLYSHLSVTCTFGSIWTLFSRHLRNNLGIITSWQYKQIRLSINKPQKGGRGALPNTRRGTASGPIPICFSAMAGIRRSLSLLRQTSTPWCEPQCGEHRPSHRAHQRKPWVFLHVSKSWYHRSTGTSSRGRSGTPVSALGAHKGGSSSEVTCLQTWARRKQAVWEAALYHPATPMLAAHTPTVSQQTDRKAVHKLLTLNSAQWVSVWKPRKCSLNKLQAWKHC